MEEKLSKQNIYLLTNIDDKTLNILKENNIKTIGQLCNNTKSDLKNIGLLHKEIDKIEIELQLEGLNLRNGL